MKKIMSFKPLDAAIHQQQGHSQTCCVPKGLQFAVGVQYISSDTRRLKKRKNLGSISFKDKAKTNQKRFSTSEIEANIAKL